MVALIQNYKTLVITIIIIIIISGPVLAGSLEQANNTTRFYRDFMLYFT